MSGTSVWSVSATAQRIVGSKFEFASVAYLLGGTAEGVKGFALSAIEKQLPSSEGWAYTVTLSGEESAEGLLELVAYARKKSEIGSAKKN